MWPSEKKGAHPGGGAIPELGDEFLILFIYYATRLRLASKINNVFLANIPIEYLQGSGSN